MPMSDHRQSAFFLVLVIFIISSCSLTKTKTTRTSIAIDRSEQIVVTRTVDFGVCIEYFNRIFELSYCDLLTENMPQNIMTSPTTTGSMKI